MTTQLFLGLTAIAWLVPNHYAPWSSAWGDALAITGLLLLALVATTGVALIHRVSWRLLGVGLVCCSVLLAQLATGRLTFAGDAWMVALYAGLWLLAVMCGGWMTSPQNSDRGGLNAMQMAWLLGALLSVGVALVQWTGAVSLGIFGAEMPPGARPFGNVAQPNHLCTICFLGLCALLWLHQHKRVGGAVFWLGACFLLLGMVMTQSRTGWLQIGLLVFWGLVMRTRAGLRVTRQQLLAIGGLFVAGVLLWPTLCEWLLLSPGRSIGDQMRAGIRVPYWLSMLDAVAREPLWGYGWQQIGAAQQRVALDHPSVGIMFEHSHNLLLDLLLWNGVPAGGLIVVLLAWWGLAHIRACRDARVAWLLLAVGGVFTHAMLEFPLEYAYFLIPVGLAMGAIDGLSPSGRALALPHKVVLSFTLLLSVVFGVITVEYLKAEQNYRVLRLESARIGVHRLETPAVELKLLTQLGAFLQFARIEARPDMAPEEVDWMRKVSERFGYAPVMFRYALAAGLNGQPDAALETLNRLCRIHEPQRCVEAREGWAALRGKYPKLPPMMD